MNSEGVEKMKLLRPMVVEKEARVKDVTRRWLKALQIAKILFEDQGYHTRYLDEIEDHIRGVHKN
jgi:hypothetical protein